MHRSRGRTRLRIPSRRNDREYFTRLVTGLRAGPEVSDIRVNPSTGSLLFIDPDAAAIHALVEHGCAKGLFELLPGVDIGMGEVRLAQTVEREARGFDRALRRLTGGRIDLREIAFLALFGGAIYQLLRGDVLAPAATLGWYAAAILAAPPRPTEG